QMARVLQAQALTMDWCLDCHRQPERHLRPLDQITNMEWKADNQLALGQALRAEHHVASRTDCVTCHRCGSFRSTRAKSRGAACWRWRAPQRAGWPRAPATASEARWCLIRSAIPR